MRIWIDFINSPQVSFFEPLINELTKSGHEIVLTCRDSANTVDLIKQRNWEHTIIGTEVKKTTVKKLLAFPLRIYALLSFLKNKRIDVAICQSSFYLPLTARLLGIPSIYTNDNEHALGNIPAFLFATKIFIPENLSLSKVVKMGAKRSKVCKYPGIKEGVYLWPKGVDIQSKRATKDFSKHAIYVRPEPSTAQYYSGKHNFLDQLLLELKEHHPITILTREKAQLAHYTQSAFSGIEVPVKPLPFEEVATNCALFIGAGGSMTREMALIGVPTVSVYQGELLEVDRFLIAEKLMIHKSELQYKEVEAMIAAKASQDVNMSLINKGKEAYQLFKQAILKYNKQ
ncbi:DUF354 domain-containing protein [Ilyomonas limi]|uniref:DUF354 domain-containing protein n=1 Tax=Ilyomonas limi TaxID=2575867 RepID=A0A4U3L566_9BACT|nr:DUF354 domain-containing protein [Ilyomonas limi]TKK70341.1 DUF354 domain-containing protein [Ilyomonas limi]